MTFFHGAQAVTLRETGYKTQGGTNWCQRDQCPHQFLMSSSALKNQTPTRFKELTKNLPITVQLFLEATKEE